MNKKTIKLWNEYQTWVKDHNKKIFKIQREMNRKEMERYEKLSQKYQKINKKRECDFDRQWAEYKKWQSQPWYKKLFSAEPYPPVFPTFPRVPFPTYIPAIGIEKATVEGFMDWLVKNNNL